MCVPSTKGFPCMRTLYTEDFFKVLIYNIFFQVMIGLDGKRLETESNVLLASIENMQYAVTLDVLHMVLLSLINHFYIIF